MNERIVGKIKNIQLSPDDDSLEIVVKIFDQKFKRKILRDLSLSGNLQFVEDKLVFCPDEEEP